MASITSSFQFCISISILCSLETHFQSRTYTGNTCIAIAFAQSYFSIDSNVHQSNFECMEAKVILYPVSIMLFLSMPPRGFVIVLYYFEKPLP